MTKNQGRNDDWLHKGLQTHVKRNVIIGQLTGQANCGTAVMGY